MGPLTILPNREHSFEKEQNDKGCIYFRNSVMTSYGTAIIEGECVINEVPFPNVTYYTLTAPGSSITTITHGFSHPQ